MKDRYRVWNWGKAPKNKLRIYKSFRTFRKARKYLQYVSQFDRHVTLYDCKTCKKYTMKDIENREGLMDWIAFILGGYGKVHDNGVQEGLLKNGQGRGDDSE